MSISSHQRLGMLAVTKVLRLSPVTARRKKAAGLFGFGVVLAVRETVVEGKEVIWSY